MPAGPCRARKGAAARTAPGWVSAQSGRTAAERAAYWASGEPADKAGGYAIQGRAAMFVARLEGSFSGVMGLPLFETAELLETCGMALLGTGRL